MLIFASFWDRFLNPFGLVLGSTFAAFGCQKRIEMSPKSMRKLALEKLGSEDVRPRKRFPGWARKPPPPSARSSTGTLWTPFPFLSLLLRFLSLLLRFLSFSFASLRDFSRRRRPKRPQSSKSRSQNQPKLLPKSIPKSSEN